MLQGGQISAQAEHGGLVHRAADDPRHRGRILEDPPNCSAEDVS
jgi:hypothetical protein